MLAWSVCRIPHTACADYIAKKTSPDPRGDPVLTRSAGHPIVDRQRRMFLRQTSGEPAMSYKTLPIFLAFFLMGLADAMGPNADKVQKAYRR